MVHQAVPPSGRRAGDRARPARLTIDRGARRAAARTVFAALAALVATTVLAACADSAGIEADNYDIEFDFSNGQQDWAAGFVDYPVGKEIEWALSSSLAPLPAPLNGSRKGILLTGANHSDDLFMYVTREMPGLTARRTYAARFLVTIATNAPRDCAGIGGAPGESVVLKVGGTSLVPQRVVDAAQYYRASFDHGQQLRSGREASAIGDLANSNTNCLTPRYELKQFDSGTTPITITTDASGRFWLVVGAESGFEGTTSFYITAVRVAIDPL
jgi:hypothetical protein